jgi:hypothetical protein
VPLDLLAIRPDLTPSQVKRLNQLDLTDEEKVAILTLNDSLQFDPALLYNPTFTEWSAQNFYYPAAQPTRIKLLPHQTLIMEPALDPANAYTTVLFSTVKKSGKTALAGAAGRYRAETGGPRTQVACIANDLKQAKGRDYQAIIDSIELDPSYDRVHRQLQSKWKISNLIATYLPKNSTVEAIPLDWRGEAGGNPDLTLWSELWGFTTQAHKRMWDELTPVPTKFSQRWVETYAGFDGESELLQQLWNLATQPKEGARRLTPDDIPEWLILFPNEDPEAIPIFINKQAGIYAYVDQGPTAQRMPWQTTQYYQEQSRLLEPSTFERLHFNYWTKSASAFIPEQWAVACYDPSIQPLQSYDQDVPFDSQSPIPPGQTFNPYSKVPIVIGADASVSGDCTALIGVAKHLTQPNHVVVLFHNVWYPTPDNPMDYSTTIEAAIRWYARHYNIAEVAYDPYQLHYMCTNLNRDFVVWCKPFSQMGKRMEADKELYDLFKDRHLHHPFHNLDDVFFEHVAAAGKVQSPKENTKLRIVKKAESSKIDLVIALSMAAKERLWLLV